MLIRTVAISDQTFRLATPVSPVPRPLPRDPSVSTSATMAPQTKKMYGRISSRGGNMKAQRRLLMARAKLPSNQFVADHGVSGTKPVADRKSWQRRG